MYFDDEGHSYDAIYIMAPKYFVGANTDGNYFYGTLKPTITTGSSEIVQGHARYSVASMTMKIYKPNSSTASYTYSVSNCSDVSSGYITFNQTGLWRVVISGSGLPFYTFTIRVASYAEAGNDID
jgi:hypothetical protein